MTKDKTIVSEEEFNRRSRSSWKHPGADSPGDSEKDSESEIEMGFNYAPAVGEDLDEKENVEDDDTENEVTDPFPKIKPAPIKEPPSKEKFKKEADIPESAKVLASDLPSHRQDRESSSDTH